MKTLVGIITVTIGIFLYRWWASINNKRRPYHIPFILKYHEGLVLLGYLLWLAIIIYGLVILFKVSILLPFLFLVIYFFINNFVSKNDSLDSQISWIFKFYQQEKQDRNNYKKTEAELLQITAKRYLSTTVWSDRYYLFEKNPPKNLKQLTSDLISCVCDIWINPEDETERLKLWEIKKERIELIYNKYFQSEK